MALKVKHEIIRKKVQENKCVQAPHCSNLEILCMKKFFSVLLN